MAWSDSRILAEANDGRGSRIARKPEPSMIFITGTSPFEAHTLFNASPRKEHLNYGSRLDFKRCRRSRDFYCRRTGSVGGKIAVNDRTPREGRDLTKTDISCFAVVQGENEGGWDRHRRNENVCCSSGAVSETGARKSRKDSRFCSSENGGSVFALSETGDSRQHARFPGLQKPRAPGFTRSVRGNNGNYAFG